MKRVFFRVWCFQQAPVQHCTRCLLAQCCRKSIQTTLNRIFFLCNVVWSLLDNIAQSFYLCNVFARILGLYWTGLFHVQYFLEALGQHCTRFLPMQYCPKSIKTTLNKIFFLFHVVWSQLDSIAQSVYLCNVVPRVLRQHWTGFLSVQCCLESFEQHCKKFLPVHAVLSQKY